jgi:hypothetical protein
MRILSSGTGSAKIRFVQVQITEFSSDSFPMPIGLRSVSGIDAAAATLPRSTRTTLNPDESTNESGPSTIESLVCQLKQARQTHNAKRGIVGTSCLSIIGMIRPGRTVRLYRQIH